MTPTKIGIIATALSTDPRAAARAARLMTFDGLQFDAVSSTLDLTSLSLTGRREFRHVLSSAGRELIGLRAELGPKGFGIGADVDQLLARLSKILEAAAGLQSPLVTLDLGPLPQPPPSIAPKKQITPDMAGMLIL